MTHESRQKPKFEQLDALRFFAILPVLIAHWREPHNFFYDHIFTGARGVQLFFVLSGFLITLGLISSRYKAQTTQRSLYTFYVRRILRIFPVYYLTLLLIWLYDHQRVAESIWWNIFYASNFYNIIAQKWTGSAHLWSLAVEEQFYLVWPLAILLVPRRLLLAVIGSAIALSVGAKLYWAVYSWPWWYSYVHPLAALDSLASGALLSYAYYFHRERLRSLLYNAYVIMAIGLSGVLGLAGYKIPYFTLSDLCVALFFAWVIGRAVYGFSGIAGYILGNAVLRYIGTISYCIYVIHVYVPDLTDMLGIHFIKGSRFICLFLITISFASLSWYAFESQILKLKSYFE